MLTDDPAAFESELLQRERQLGPDHPDVAEACSNLAILYNQKVRGRPCPQRRSASSHVTCAPSGRDGLRM